MPIKNNSVRRPLILSVLLCLFGMPLVAQQSLYISYDFNNKKLSEAFQELEAKYDLTFAYDDDLIEQYTIAQASAKKRQLDKALKQILEPHNLGFEILNNQFVLIKQVYLPEKQSYQEKESVVLPEICGYIKDSLNEQALSYANVWLKGSNQGIHTNDAGFFRFAHAFEKEDTLQISYLGYNTQELAVADLLNKDCRQIVLSIQQIEFEQILIKERAIALLRSENNGTGIQFETDKMGMLPGWGDNDVLRMAQLIPGVHSTDESASELHIRGGTPDQNLILWEGIPIYHAGHLFGMFSAVNPSVADEVKIYRGGFGARYGDRVSGLIEINAPSEIPDSAEFGAGLNLINAHAYAKLPFMQGKSSLLVAVRRSYTDLIQSDTYKKLFDQVSGKGKIEDHQRTAEREQIDLRTNSVFHFSDVNLKWTYQPKDSRYASLSFYNGKDELNYNVSLDLSQYGIFFDSEDDISLGNYGISGLWKEKWNPRLESSLNISYTKFKHLYRVSYTGDKEVDYQVRLQQLNRMKDFAFHQDNRWTLNKYQSLGFGYHYTSKLVEYDLSHEEINKEPNTAMELFQGDLNTFYIDYDYKYPDQIALDFGLRYNRIGQLPIAYWEPRITIDAKISNDLHLKAAAGKYIQFVSQMIQYNDLALGEEIWIMANQKYSIPPVSSTQFSTGIWMDKKDFLLDVEVYSKKLKGLTSINLRFNDREESPFSGGEADILGMDVLLKKRWNKYSAWLSYSVGNVSYSFPSINDSQPFPATHDQLHTINWTHLLSLENWEFSLSWNYGSGRPYTNALNIEETTNGDNTNYSILYGNRNEERLPAYHRMDISGHYHWKGADGINGKVGLSIFNVYDQRNIFNKQFYILNQEEQSNPDPKPELLLIDQQMLGFIPNLFLELSW